MGRAELQEGVPFSVCALQLDTTSCLPTNCVHLLSPPAPSPLRAQSRLEALTQQLLAAERGRSAAEGALVELTQRMAEQEKRLIDSYEVGPWDHW